MTRLFPHDLDAEMSVLGSIMAKQDIYPDIAAIVGPEDFFKLWHQNVWRVIADQLDRGAPVDPVSLADVLGDQVARFGTAGRDYLHQLYDAAMPGSAEYHADIVRAKAQLRRGSETATRALQALDNPGTTPGELAELFRAAAEDLAADGPEQRGRRLRITPLAKIRLRATYWLWAERIPVGGLTLWAGREGIGRSTSAAWLAAQITRGTLPGMHRGHPRSVFYAASEDSWERTVAPRLVAAGADLERTFRIDVVEEDRPGLAAPLTLPADTSTLGAEMQRHDVGLLVVDPLVSALTGSIDTHRDREVRSALEPLGAIADQAAAAVLGLVHFGKGSSTDPLSLILGSRAFAATARAVICMARDTESEDDTVVLSQEKNNLGRLDIPSLTYKVTGTEIDTEDGPSSVGRVEFTGQSDRSVADMLAEGAMAAPVERSERNEAAEWLRGYLTKHDGAAPSKDVKKAAAADDIAERTLQRAIKRIGVIDRNGFGQGTIWRLEVKPLITDRDNPSASAPQPRHSRQDSEPGADGADGGATGAGDGQPSLSVAPEGDTKMTEHGELSPSGAVAASPPLALSLGGDHADRDC